MVEEIRAELSKINWDSPEITMNEIILKTIVEQLLFLVVEETKEISEYRKILINMKKNKRIKLSNDKDEIISINPSGIDYQKALMEIAELVKKIQSAATQMQREREAAKKQNQAMTKQLMTEIEFLRSELNRKRTEPDSPFRTPAKPILKTTTTNVIITNDNTMNHLSAYPSSLKKQLDDIDKQNEDHYGDTSLLSTPKQQTPTPKKAQFIFGNESSELLETPQRGTEGQTRDARKKTRYTFRQNVPLKN